MTAAQVAAVYGVPVGAIEHILRKADGRFVVSHGGASVVGPQRGDLM
jgi:hypothetical protein